MTYPWQERAVPHIPQHQQIAPALDTDEDLQALYNWVNKIPLSRPKRNISKDFADGVLFAEVVNHFFPRLVEMHNYSSANSDTQKMYNWSTLNQKVLKKLGYQIHQQDLEDVIKAAPGAVERVLAVLHSKVDLAANRQLKVAVPGASSQGPSGRPPAPGVPASERSSVAGSARGQEENSQTLASNISVELQKTKTSGKGGKNGKGKAAGATAPATNDSDVLRMQELLSQLDHGGDLDCVPLHTILCQVVHHLHSQNQVLQEVWVSGAADHLADAGDLLHDHHMVVRLMKEVVVRYRDQTDDDEVQLAEQILQDLQRF